MGNKLYLVLFLVVIMELASCTAEQQKETPLPTGPLPREQEIQETKAAIEQQSTDNLELITEDNIKIMASYYKGDPNRQSIILLHMLNKDRNDWNEFAEFLNEFGFNVVSIDLRGHGQSQLKWKDFSKSEFNRMVLDAKAAKEFLGKNTENSETYLIGASIGANVALSYSVSDPDVKKLVLLSPGLDYRGVTTKDKIAEFKYPLLIVASEGDKYAADSSKELDSLAENSKLIMFEGPEHGTNMFHNTELNLILIDWLI